MENTRDELRHQFWLQHAAGKQQLKQTTFYQLLNCVETCVERHLRVHNLPLPIPQMPRNMGDFETCYWYLEIQWQFVVTIRLLKTIQLERKLSTMNLNDMLDTQIEHLKLIKECSENGILYGRKAASLARFI